MSPVGNSYNQIGVLVVPNVARLRALNSPSIGNGIPVIFLQGVTAQYDGGEGWFEWIPTSTDPDDGINIIASNWDQDAGRWVRLDTIAIISSKLVFVSAYPTLAAALAVAVSRGATLCIDAVVSQPSDITLNVQTAIVGGAMINAAGHTVTYSVGVSGPITRIFGSGTHTITVAQPVWVDWWALAILTDATAVQNAITNTAEGSEIQFNTRWRTDGIQFIAGRDNYKKLLGRSGMPAVNTRTAAGAGLDLSDGVNVDVILFPDWAGVRCGVVLDNFRIWGNKAANTAGKGVYVNGVKELYIGTLVIDHCAGDGINFETAKSSNGCYFQHINSESNGGVGADLTGFADSYFDTLTCGANASHGLLCGGANIQGDKYRAFLNGANTANTAYGLLTTAQFLKIADVHCNDNNASGIRVQGGNTQLQIVYCKNNGQNVSVPIANRNNLEISASATQTQIGNFWGQDDQVTATVNRHIYFSTTGGENQVVMARYTGTAPLSGKNLDSNGTSNLLLGNIVGLPNQQTIAYASTMSFDHTKGTEGDITLTGDGTLNAAASTTIFDTMTAIIVATQDSSGGHAFTFGTNFTVSTAIDTTASKTTRWVLIAKGGKWVEQSAHSWT